MDNKYNEKKYGELIYNNGFQSRFLKYEILVLVKYLKCEKGLSRKETEEFVYKFCKKHIEGFNKVKYFKIIDNAIRNGRKKDNKLIVVKDIPILKSELEYLDNLEIDHEYKKLLLSFLVNKKISFEIHKLSNPEATLSTYFSGSNKKYREVFKTANISNKYKVNEMINVLVNKKIVNSVIQGDIVLNFMYSIYKTTEEKIITENKDINDKEISVKKTIIYNVSEDDIYEKINDFNNIGYLFDYYKGVNNIKKCINCGKRIKARSNKTKYCKVCAREKEKEKYRKYNKKRK